MFQTKVVEKIKTHNLYLVTFFFFENCAVYEKIWKNPEELGRSDDNTAHAHCKLDT